MAPFSSRFITSACKTWASLLRTVVVSTPWKRSVLQVNWSVQPRFTVVITQADTLGMAGQGKGLKRLCRLAA